MAPKKVILYGKRVIFGQICNKKGNFFFTFVDFHGKKWCFGEILTKKVSLAKKRGEFSWKKGDFG